MTEPTRCVRCGEIPRLQGGPLVVGYRFRCRDTGCWVGPKTETIKEAAAAWNAVMGVREELIEAYEDSLCQIGHMDDEGWIDSQALSAAAYAGDRLCELVPDKWERSDIGRGKRQWYRRKKEAGE